MCNLIVRIIATSILSIPAILLLSVSAHAQTYSVNGALIEVSLVPDRTIILLDEPIHLSVIIRNLSGVDLQFTEGGDYRNRLGRPESYDVRAVRSDGMQVPKPEILLSMGGLIGSEEVPAGGTITRRLFLPHWAPFEETGVYTITCERTFHFYDSGKFLVESTSVPVRTSTRIEVVESGQQKLGEIIEKLGAELLGADEETAQRASLSLDYINDERTISYFVRAIDLGDDRLMRHSLKALSKYNNDSAIEGIKKGMKSDETSVRRAGNRHTANFMAENVRLAAADALRDSKHPQAISLLLSMREDHYWSVRLRVVQALAGLESDEATESLRKMANDENEDVRQQAKQYLSARKKD